MNLLSCRRLNSPLAHQRPNTGSMIYLVKYIAIPRWQLNMVTTIAIFCDLALILEQVIQNNIQSINQSIILLKRYIRSIGGNALSA